MKLSKIALATAAVAAIASGSAFAGNFQPNTTSVAREVIIGAAQAIVAPQVSYSFVGPLRNPSNTTYFQIQLDLKDGAQWIPGTTSTGFAGAAPGNVALVDAAGNVVANAWGAVLNTATPGKLYATFEIAAGVSINNTRVIWNAAAAAGAPAGSPAAADQLKIKNLTAITGTSLALKADGTCDADIKNATGEVFQYPNITDPTFQATDANSASPASEHLLPAAQNKGPVVSFPVNLLLGGTASTILATQDYNTGAKFFKIGTNTTPTGQTANIGTVKYTKPANGLDTNLSTIYGGVPATVPAVAVSNAGPVEIKDYSVTLTGTFAATAKFSLQAAACTDVLGAAGAAPVGNTVVAKNVSVGDLVAGTNLNVCYYVDGTSAIPTTALPAILTLNKAPDNAGNVATRFEELPNICKANFIVGSGIKIDIRNYASRTKFPTGNFASYVRLINNSESATADVFAQMIYADGKYGPYGQLPTLAPRAVMNLSNTELEAFLKNAAPVTAFTSSTKYTSDQTAAPTYIGAVAGAGVQAAAGTGDRIRFVSTTGTTLRVQSYLLLPTGNLLDTTSAQGVDYEASTDRVPANALDAQPVSQDAINGLAR